MAVSVRHDPDQNCFSATVEGGNAVLTYERPGPGLIDLQHTVVPQDAQGRGVGQALVEAAMRFARAQELHVIPTCPFVQHWLDEHPEAGDLVAR